MAPRRALPGEPVTPLLYSARRAAAEAAARQHAVEPDGVVAGPTTDTADSPADEADGRGGTGDLFGRGMLYVLIWSGQMVVATVVSPILTHVLPVREFGALAAAIALYQLLITVIVLGLDQALEMQRVADRDDDRPARGLLATGIVVAVAATALLGVTSPWWAATLGFAEGAPLVLITLLWTAPGAAVLMALSLLQAEDRLLRFSLVSLLSTVGSQVFGLVLMFLLGRSAEIYAWGGVIGQGAALLLGIIWTRPLWSGMFQRDVLRRGLGLGIPLVLTGLSTFVIAAGDRFLIQRWLGVEQVARFQVAFTVGHVVTLMLTFTNRAWLPRLKSIVDETSRWRVIAESRDGIYVLLGWAVAGIGVAAPALLRIFAPESYDPGGLVLVVVLVAVSGFPVAAGGASSRMLVTLGRSSALAWSAGAAVAIKIVGTVAVLQWWGTLEAVAVVTLVAVWAQAWWLRVAVRKLTVPMPSSRVSVLVPLLLVGLTLASTLLPQTTPWLVTRFVLAVLLLAPFTHTLLSLRSGHRGPVDEGRSSR